MSSNSTALPGAVTQCCTATTLLAGAVVSFVFCSLFVLIFLCLCFLLLRRRWRRSARLLQEQEQEQPRPKLGLDAAAIARLPTFPYRRDDADAECSTAAPAGCVVCLNVLDEGQMARQLLGCKHVFHQECIDVWLASCPMCRATIGPARAEERAAVSTSACVAPVDDEIVASSSTPVETKGGLRARPEAGSGLK